MGKKKEANFVHKLSVVNVHVQFCNKLFFCGNYLRGFPET